jgi:endonuclease/exonuclease/phosphatase family metal-dependent hydrolase
VRWLWAALAGVLVLGLAGCITSQLGPAPEVFESGDASRAAPAAEGLRLMTLNLAHGRGTGFHQALQGEARARANLAEIEAMLQREQPHVIALQEADRPSGWSGDFDHVNFIAQAAGFDWGVHTAHAEGMGQSYGTAVIARLPLDEHGAYTFQPAVAALPKGFSLATIRWPETGLTIDVVSVHLEPLRTAVRQRQARELVAALADRGRPLILMGDFNTEWDGEDGVLATIAGGLSLTAYVPTAGLVTYPRLSRRIDWILVSCDFVFSAFRVLEDEVSDHRAVVAEVRAAYAYGDEPGTRRCRMNRRPEFGPGGM